MTDLKMFEKDSKTGKKKYIPGSWRKLFRMNGWAFMCVLVIVFNFYMYNPVSEECREAISNPCLYCREQIIMPYNFSVNNTVIGNDTNDDSQENFTALYRAIQQRPDSNW